MPNLLPRFFKKKRVFLIKNCDQQSTETAEKRIIKKLKRKAQTRSQKFSRKIWEQALGDGQQPVIVFCVISSRIGTDIEHAMKGVHDESPVILVLLHCVLKDLLKGDLSDDEELLDPKLINRMTGIVHFAFSDEGLYHCPQNKAGKKKLKKSVKTIMKSKRKKKV